MSGTSRARLRKPEQGSHRRAETIKGNVLQRRTALGMSHDTAV